MYFWSVQIKTLLLAINGSFCYDNDHDNVNGNTDFDDEEETTDKGCFTYTPIPNRTETVTANELHHFVFGRPFTYEPNPWTKSKKKPV